MQLRKLAAIVVAGFAVAQAAAGWVWLSIAPSARGVAYLGVATVLGLATVALGVLVAVRRPDNVVGALLAWVGVMPIDMASSDLYADAFARRPDLVPVSALLVALYAGSWMFLYVPPALLA